MPLPRYPASAHLCLLCRFAGALRLLVRRPHALRQQRFDPFPKDIGNAPRLHSTGHWRALAPQRARTTSIYLQIVLLRAMAAAKSVPDGDRRRASAHHQCAPVAARLHTSRCPCTSRTRRHRYRTVLQPPAQWRACEDRVTACKVCNSSSAAKCGLGTGLRRRCATFAADSGAT